jgi:hypothetical protein
MFSSLPTDNFYKFGFVGSLVLLVFFINMLNNKIEKQKDYSFQIDLKTVELDVKYESITTKANLIEAIFNSEIDSLTASKFTAQFEDLESQKSKLDVEKSINNTHIEDYNEKLENLIIDKWVYGILIALSTLSVFIFGGLWYNKVQVLEDEILKDKVPKK